MGASTSTSLFAEGGAGTLRLLMYLAAALVLMVADHRGGHLDRVRQVASQAMDPLYWLAAAPARAIRAVNSNLSTRVELATRNEALSRELLLANARLHRLGAVQQENRRLRALMGGIEPHALSVQLATLLDIDLDPFRHRVVLDSGARQGVRVGLAIVDASGVMGQVAATSGSTSTAILISDPNHAIPVQVRRSGVRTIAFGTGRTDELLLPNIPPSADVRVGDELVTSGLGGTFPAGFPVGRLTALEPDATRLFLVGHAAPASALNRSGEVLLVWTSDAASAGPPAPEPAGEAGSDSVEPAPTGPVPDTDAAPVEPAADDAQSETAAAGEGTPA